MNSEISEIIVNAMANSELDTSQWGDSLLYQLASEIQQALSERGYVILKGLES